MVFTTATLSITVAGLLVGESRLAIAAPTTVPASDAGDAGFATIADARAAIEKYVEDHEFPIDLTAISDDSLLEMMGDPTGLSQESGGASGGGAGRERRFFTFLPPNFWAEYSRSFELPVCKSGAFSPDPQKYYTIATGSLYWAHSVSQDPWTGSWTDRQNTPGKHIVLQSDKVGMNAQWRFERSMNGANVYWSIVNRLTGLKLLAGGRMKTDHSGYPVAAKCSAYNVGVTFPVPGVHNGGVRCDEHGCRIGGRLNGWPQRKHETRSTSCVAYSSCSKNLGAGWTQTSKTSYFFCTVYRCERYVDVPAQKSIRSWSVHEVAEFKPRDKINPPKINLVDDAVNSYAKNLASAAIGELVGKALPFGASLVTTAISQTIPGSASINTKLESFADEMAKVTNDLISTGLADYIVNNAQDQVDLARRHFAIDYPREKHEIFGRTSAQSEERADALEELAENELQRYGQEFERATAEYFPDTAEGASLDIKRAQFGWSAVKAATIETLAVFQEAVLLKAYAVPEAPGAGCADFYRGLSIDSKVAALRERLVDTQQMLVSARLRPIGASRDPAKYDSEAHDDFGTSGAKDRWGRVIGRTELYYSSPGSLSPAVNVADTYKAEIEFDLRRVTYSFDEVSTFLDQFEQATLQGCAQVRTLNSDTRKRFEV